MMRNRKGLSFFEILVVVMLMGLLGTLALPQFLHVKTKRMNQEAIKMMMATLFEAKQKAKYLGKDVYVTFISDSFQGRPDLSGRAMLLVTAKEGHLKRLGEWIRLPSDVYFENKKAFFTEKGFHILVQLENENGIGFSVSLPSICFKAKSGRLVLAGALTSTDIYLEGGDSLIHLDEVENRFKVSHES